MKQYFDYLTHLKNTLLQEVLNSSLKENLSFLPNDQGMDKPASNVSGYESRFSRNCFHVHD